MFQQVVLWGLVRGRKQSGDRSDWGVKMDRGSRIRSCVCVSWRIRIAHTRLLQQAALETTPTPIVIN